MYISNFTLVSVFQSVIESDTHMRWWMGSVASFTKHGKLWHTL
jgi:hypothetical protein